MKNGKRLSSMALAVMMATSLCSGTLTMNVSASDTDPAAVAEVSETAPASAQTEEVTEPVAVDTGTETVAEPAEMEVNTEPAVPVEEQTKATEVPTEPEAPVTETEVTVTDPQAQINDAAVENADSQGIQDGNTITPPEAQESAAETEEKADTLKKAIESRALLAGSDEDLSPEVQLENAKAAVTEVLTNYSVVSKPGNASAMKAEIKKIAEDAINNPQISVGSIRLYGAVAPTVNTQGSINVEIKLVSTEGAESSLNTSCILPQLTTEDQADKDCLTAAVVEAYAALNNYPVDNNTTSDELLDAVNNAINNPEISVELTLEKKNATEDAKGSCNINVTLSYKGWVDYTSYYRKLPKDFIEQIKAAHRMIDEFLAEYQAQDFIDASQEFIDNIGNEIDQRLADANSKVRVVEVKIPESSSFKRDIQVNVAVKRVEGVNTTGGVQRKYTNFEALRDVIREEFERAGFSNATTAEYVLQIAKDVGADLTVSWDLADGFKLTPATVDSKGEITGTLILKADDGTLTWKLDPATDNLTIPRIRNLDKEALERAKKLIRQYTDVHAFPVNDQLDSEVLRILKEELSVTDVDISWVTPPSKALVPDIYEETDIDVVLLMTHGDVQEQYTFPVCVTADAPKEYRILYGSGQQWGKGGSYELVYSLKGKVGDYTGYRIDGKDLTSDQYTQYITDASVAGGYFNVKVSDQVLKRLEIGDHTFEAHYPNGRIKTNFEVIDTSKPSDHAFESAQVVWHLGDDKLLGFYLKGNARDYRVVKIDDKFIDGVRIYTGPSGQTMFALEPKVLNGLSVGTHTVYAQYVENGETKSVETKLVVVDKGVTDDTKPESKPETKLEPEAEKKVEIKKEEVKNTTPKTGDAANAGMLLAATLLSGAGAAGAWKKKRFDQ